MPSRLKEKEIRFVSRGLELAGVLYRPYATGPVPGIVLCQGYTGTKEMFLPILAGEFAAAGYASLIFDYRGWGESEGERGRLIPLEQVEDIGNALGFLAAQDGVDARRLGLYGTSFGGANAVYAAATDLRVKCVVASLAVGNGRRWLRSLRRLWEWNELEALLAGDRQRRARGEAPGKARAFDVAPPAPAMRELIRAATEGGMFQPEPEITLESVDAILEFAPESVVREVAPRPILFVHGDSDDLVSCEESKMLYARAGEPKELVLLPGVSHLDFYLGDALEQVTAASLDWFRRYLLAI